MNGVLRNRPVSKESGCSYPLWLAGEESLKSLLPQVRIGPWSWWTSARRKGYSKQVEGCDSGRSYACVLGLYGVAVVPTGLCGVR